ncbi:MAG: isocitrate lyase/phosphoenolpyruvate mutase family protein, partial [Candidatus Omnitrophica bacterium]|nr:isocitrate lyase/phosphoenolpyruvate mutase family protein [Candidatus Omnitrophota bacterium]
MNKAHLLRQGFLSAPILRIVGAHHALGAKLIERNRFDGIWASGLEISTAHAVPDANILTMTDYLHAAVSINEATSLPVICDCDTGYGNSSNVSHMTKKYEAAGIAAIVIEDKLFPKINSFIPGRQDLATIDEFKGKIAAAKSAQRSADFMVLARVEALIAGWGMDEALKRARAYCEAGADGIVIHSKASTPDEVFAFAGHWQSKIPLVLIPTTYYGVTAEEFSKKGFKMVIYANHGLRASIRAMDETFRSIHDSGSTAAVEPSIATMREVFEIQGMNELKKEEEKFSGGSDIQAVIPAAADHHRQTGFGEILKDRPLCMLEIGGKTLLDRQADSLRSFGIREIFVVGGYSADRIKSEGVKILRNPRYADTGSAYSLMLAGDHFKKECLVAYSDILFNRLIVDQLLKSPYDVTVVIDRAYQTLPFRDKKLDLVIAED